ncbi:6-carboxytetrahydropterin synthase [Mucilaginibacter sp. cycad4]|uniref:6-pyruvoyl trahydropterin synthase family protein n=1 Tax=Mucilaginibacter sp. cycad4 TaxID=3342096 RepID=UPI002AAA78A8|nr:6-carboxytetrahydropterin synthase [Mucilaginibacter gossypii]WPV00653.1 6-carboxytetrahydropterin synthase [Mucilaginibacter gossypii]
MVKPIVAQLDHTIMNEVSGLGNPTAENLAIWIRNSITRQLNGLVKIELKETPTSGVVYDGK